MTYGYHGRVLQIDLTSQSASVLPVDAVILKRWIGGVGLGTWLLHRFASDRQDPLAPESPLVIAFSPLVGTPLTTSAKLAFVCQSPLTGRLNDSLSSSHFAITGKKTGYDAFVLTGRAPRWCTVLIEPDGVRFLDATPWLGLSSRNTGERLLRELGTGARVAAIGLAGERGVRYATVSHEGRHAGRGGTGAVCGAKRVKAIAVRGDISCETAHPRELIAFSKDLSQRSLGPATEKYRELGTISNLFTFNRLGVLPTRNFQESTFDDAHRFQLETLRGEFEQSRASCAACTIGCEHILTAPGQGSGVRMEYESLFALGPLCGIADPQVTVRAAGLCDEYGLDTISTGATLAFAMECTERGLWTEAPTLRFGQAEPLLDMIRRIAERDGPGDLLALGTRAAAEVIGQGAAEFAPHVKGLEIPGYEPRALQTMALGFAVGSRGADHNRSGAYQVDFSTAVDRLHIDDDAVPAAIETENEAALLDSLILCKFLRGVFPDRLAAMAEMLRLVTGWELTPRDLRHTAERIIRAKKWFNIRQGWTPAEDTLPARFLSQPLPTGPSAGAALSASRLRELIALYNRLRGWTDEGYVPPELMRDDIADGERGQ